MTRQQAKESLRALAEAAGVPEEKHSKVVLGCFNLMFRAGAQFNGPKKIRITHDRAEGIVRISGDGDHQAAFDRWCARHDDDRPVNIFAAAGGATLFKFKKPRKVTTKKPRKEHSKEELQAMLLELQTKLSELS